MGNSVSCCMPVSSSHESSKTKRSSTQVYENGKPGKSFHSQNNLKSRHDGFSMSVSSTDSWGHGSTGNGNNAADTLDGKVPLRKDLLRIKGEQRESMVVTSNSVARMHSESSSNIQHISEREPEDGINDPSINPKRGPIFMVRSKSELRESRERKRRSQYLASGAADAARENGGGQTPSDRDRETDNSYHSGSGPLHRKFNSCSTIYIDDSTVSQPNLRNTIKCVSMAIFYHIKNRENHLVRTLDIFEERLHPLSKDELGPDYDLTDPEHRHVYRFLRTLFNAAQLTAECAIVTLVYLERLLTYSEMDIGPSNWKRMVLGAVLLASKVWDDQAVWNVDYCQILRDIKVEDMNELERNFLELLQFNINVPASVYAKYYFDLRSLADANEITFPTEQLSVERAQKLEALSRSCAQKVADGYHFTNALKRSSSLDNMAVNHRRSVAILS